MVRPPAVAGRVKGLEIDPSDGVGEWSEKFPGLRNYRETGGAKFQTLSDAMLLSCKNAG